MEINPTVCKCKNMKEKLNIQKVFITYGNVLMFPGIFNHLLGEYNNCWMFLKIKKKRKKKKEFSFIISLENIFQMKHLKSIISTLKKMVLKKTRNTGTLLCKKKYIV